GSATRMGSTPSWRLTGLNLPPNVQLRARGRCSGGYYNGSSGLIEQVASFSGLLPAPGINVTQASQLYDGISHVAFGSVLVGSSAPLTFTITNPGTADLSNLAVTMDGANSGDFMVSALSTTSIPVGAGTSTFTVTFSPTASGAKTAALHIASNVNGTQNPFDIVLTGTGLNNTPTLSDIANQTINEDENTGARAFTIGDVETATVSLTVSGSSSNTTLVPNGNIVFSGSGASRSVVVTPAANQFGSATITVTVGDGIATTSDTFVLTVNSVNDVPTISNLTDRTINEDASTAALSFTIGDLETAAASLSVTRSSSNTTLVPTANIVLGGSGASRTVTVTPAANQFGNVTITVNVSDGTDSVGDTFFLTVNPVNDAPVISGQQALSTPEETALSIGLANLTVIDPDNVYSTDFTLAVQGGTNYARTGNTITPALNFNGTLTVPVLVNDGMANSNTFNLSVTVTAVNDVPTISDIADLTIDEDISTGAIAFTIGDVETAAASLTVTRSSSNTTLVPTANIVLGGSGASRTVTVTPAAHQFGSATITVSVSDGTASVDDTFLLTVNPVNDAPTISNITDQSIGVNTLTNSLPFTIGDNETAAASLMVSSTSSNQTLVPDGSIFFGGSGTNRTVTVVPETNQFGTVTISVSVSDGVLTVTDTFVVTVLGADIAVEQPFNNNLTDGGTKSFGNVAVGANSSLNFFIKNTGNDNLTGLTISQDGPDAGMFTVTANPTAPVSGPNGTTAFTVRFAPTSVGLKTAAIHIASNDPDESPFDITLTGGPPAEPEIAVERSGVNIADGGSVGFVTATVGRPADVVFTVRNTGSTLLALNGTPAVAVGGTDAALFSVISPSASALGAGDSTTFIVRYTPLDSSPKTATLSLANNDTDEQPFDLNLTGAVLSFTTDTDGDGFSDAAELQMAALGYDWQVSQTALVNAFTSNANGLGYYTAAQVQALNIDVPLIQRDGLGQFKLTVGMKKSTDLLLFNPLPMNQPGMTTTINSEGKLEIQFTVPDNAAFFRLQAQ
ncbi:MAG: choice-of-anchor D domain-containing protein, partial [Verrucomicrobia bacterium]|nr:choice-of-anchor D domain-containing protein [Verrucomicrobiota bacterium]